MSDSDTDPLLILGLDPGSLHTGFGLVEKRGSNLVHLQAGRLSCSSRDPLASRLAALTERLACLLDRWAPGAVALESLFYGLNVRSLIVLAQARGAMLALLGSRGIPIREYSPAEVKTAITGNGRADKQQVARMVRMLLSLKGEPESTDATDALALAICYAQRYQMDQLEARYASSLNN